MNNEAKAPDVSKISEWTAEEVDAYVASFAKAGPIGNQGPAAYDAYLTATSVQEDHRLAKDPRQRDSHGNVLCERCSGAVQDYGVVYGSHVRECDCSRRFRNAQYAIRRVDISGDMTFETLTDPHESVSSTANKLKAIVAGEREQGVFMFGLPGRGKTHLSVATARGLLERNVLVGIYNLAGLVSRIQDTYGYDDASESRTKIVQDVCRHSVVILDDIGKEHRSSNVESIIYEIVDGLYNAKITLIASSNLPGKEFVARYDGAVLSRLGGMCEKVVIRGDDQRAKKWDW